MRNIILSASAGVLGCSLAMAQSALTPELNIGLNDDGTSLVVGSGTGTPGSVVQTPGGAYAYNITGSSFSTDQGNGLNAAAGYTIVIDAQALTTASSGTLFVFRSSASSSSSDRFGLTFDATTGGMGLAYYDYNGRVSQYSNGTRVDLISADSVAAVGTEWTTWTLTFKTLESGGTDMTLSAYGSDGRLLGFADYHSDVVPIVPDNGLNLIQKGTWGDVTNGAVAGDVLLGDISFYAGVLTEEQQAQLAQDRLSAYVAAPAVPEPTTATLSLLALDGLVARRRRK